MTDDPVARRQRPKTLTVFAAAFVAGAVLAYGVDRVVDVHVVQVEPQVESEPIFVALRSLPQGAPLTVWDVALKDWPKAMLPTTALKADASLEGMVLRHPIREGQPLLSVQLVRDGAATPVAGLAALPLAAGTAGAAMAAPAPAAVPVGTPTAGGNQHPVGAERFVPATPAEATVAATLPEAAVDVVAMPAPAEPPAAGDPTVPELAAIATDSDIDPAEQVPDVVDSEAVAAPAEVAAVEPIVGEPVGGQAVAEPALVSVVVPPPTEAAVASPLAAPVPTLPTTDIAGSLATVGRAGPAGAATVPNARPDQAPRPQAPAASAAPRNHLVMPERVALAADASFTQRPAPVAKAGVAPAKGASVAAKGAPAAAKNTAAAARAGGRKAKPTPPADTRPERTNAAARKAAPNSRQPAVTKPTDKAQPARATGLGAWFPQFSGGSKQR